jgi:hypothetical protein
MRKARLIMICCWTACWLMVGHLAWAIATVQLVQARTDIAEESLLDVGIQVFDPGLPDGDDLDLDELEAKGVFADVRKSECRFIPFHLKNTLQSTGHWGAVRVIPAGADAVDLRVIGEILDSTGFKLALQIQVVDAQGRVWLDKRYKEQANARAYRDAEIESPDPYQNLYNRVANDMLATRNQLTEDEIRELRTLSRLQFAVALAPVAFAGYLDVNKKGRSTIHRLPAADDPMMERISRIRERDYMFVDTLNEYYADFYARVDEPYLNWRAFSYEEQVALREVRRAARWRTILGAVAILGSLASDGKSEASSVARDAALIGGLAAVTSGINKQKEAKIHREALRELGASFDAEVESMLVDVEGQTMRLSGSMETQYETWRKLLRDIFVTETGLPLDPNKEGALDAGRATVD